MDLLVVLVLLLVMGGGFGWINYPAHGPQIGVGALVAIILVIVLLRGRGTSV